MNGNFIRWSGVAAVLGGLIVGVGAFLNEPFTGQYLLDGLPATVLTGAPAFLTAPATVMFGFSFVAAGYSLWKEVGPAPAEPSTTPSRGRSR